MAAPLMQESGCYDAALYGQALVQAGLPADWPYTFCKMSGDTLGSCHVDRASQGGSAVWTLMNRPRTGFPPRKPRNEDIAVVQNITIDAEYPADPSRIHTAVLEAVTELTAVGLLPPGIVPHDSGAGPHLVIPVQPITTADHGGPEIVNTAIARIVKRNLVPVLQAAAARHGLDGISFGGFAISSLLSLPGTGRPAGHKPGDTGFLRDGYLRRWLAPEGAPAPQRVESPLLTALIVAEAREVQAEQAALAARPAPTVQPSDASAREIESWIANRAADLIGEDRSANFHSLVIATHLKFDSDAPRTHAALIDRLTGCKYAKRAEREVERCLAKAPTRDPNWTPQRVQLVQQTAPADAERIAALEAESVALRADNELLRAQVESYRAELAEVASSSAAETITELRRHLAREQSAHRQLADLMVCKDLTLGQRVITARAMEKAGAFRVPPEFGVPVPDPEPRPISMGGLAEEVGVSARTIPSALKASDSLGIVTREERLRRVTLPSGEIETRMDVVIGPGLGVPHLVRVDLRRKAEADRKRAERAARDAREAALRERIDTLEKAASRAEHGCPLCGDDLIATGHVCRGCGTEYQPEELAATPYPPDSGRLEEPSPATQTGEAGATQGTISAPPTHRNPVGNRSNYIPTGFLQPGDDPPPTLGRRVPAP